MQLSKYLRMYCHKKIYMSVFRYSFCKGAKSSSVCGANEKERSLLDVLRQFGVWNLHQILPASSICIVLQNLYTITILPHYVHKYVTCLLHRSTDETCKCSFKLVRYLHTRVLYKILILKLLL